MPQQSINALDRRSYSAQNDSVGNAVLASTEQMIAVTDILSEGPIEGLVNGGQSVFLNNDPMIAEEEAPYKNNSTNIRLVANSTTATVLLNGGETFKAKTGTGIKYLHIYSAYKTVVTASDFNDVDVLGWTAAKLTKVSGTDFSSNWVTPIASAWFPARPANGGFLINLTTSKGKTWKDIKLLADSDGDDDTLTMRKNGTVVDAFEEGEANGVVEHTLNIDTFIQITKINDNNTITLANAPTIPAGDYKFSITGPALPTGYERKYKAGVRFNPGTLEQEALTTLEGVGTSSVALTVTNNALEKFTGSNYTTVTASGAQAAQIDEVKLIMQYPQGCYLLVDRSGSVYKAGVAYHIEIKVANGTDSSYRTVLPPPGLGAMFDSSRSATDAHNPDGNDTTVWKQVYKKRSKFSTEFRINLEGLQPFTGFTIRISRITKHATDDFTAENRFRENDGEGGIDEHLRSAEGGQADFNSGGEDKHLSGYYTSNLTQALGIIKEKLNFPYTAYAHTTFSSKTFQSNPTRAYECKGMKIKLPSNYITREENDGINAKYTRTGEGEDISAMTTPQLWNGEFRSKRVYSDNPAWVFYDICTNDRYGLGDFLLESDIDKFSLYKVAKYCDELVPNGKGGLEPRFRSNIYLTKATDAYKILKDFATVFRGILYWQDSQFVTVIDEPKEPIYTFSRANVIEGSFEYQSTGSKTRVNQVVVNWNNPESEYKIEPLIIEDRENIIKTGKIKSDKVVAFGCTSEGQAVRYGRWKLWTSINQTELVSFKTGLNGAFLVPGDIINIQDEAEYKVPFSGRVNTCTTTILTADRSLSGHINASGYEYTLAVIIPKRTVILNQEAATLATSGGNVTYSRGAEVTQATVGGSTVTLLNADEDTTNKNLVSAVDTSGDSVNLQYIEETVVEERAVAHGSISLSSDGLSELPFSPAFSVTPTNGAIWALKEVTTADNLLTEVSYKEYKILDIAEEGKTEFGITAVEHYNTKFDSVDRDFTLSDPDPLYKREDGTTDVPPPQNVRLIRTPEAEMPGEELNLEWDAPGLQTTNADAQNAFVEYENLGEYEVEHTFGEETGHPEIFSRDREDRAVAFHGIRDGLHRAKVTTISALGRRSLPAVFDIEVKDIFEGNYPRIGGILQGGYATRDIEVTDTGTVTFTGSSYIAAPFTSIRSAKQNTEADADTYSMSVTELAGSSWPTVGPLHSQGYVFLDFSEVDQAAPDADAMKLIVRKIDTSFDTAIDYWYDAKKYIADNDSIWTSVSTAVAVTQGSSRITGSGFLGLQIPEAITIGSSFGAKVGLIISDSEIYLDRPWTDASATSQTLKRQELTIDYRKDFLLAAVSYNSTTSKYRLGGSTGAMTYIEVTPDLDIVPRAIVAPLSTSILNYDTDDTQLTTYNSITLDITALGYQYAEIKVTGGGFSQTNQSADADYVTTSNNTRSVTVHSNSSAIAYSSGTALNFTIDVREKLDPANTAKQKSLTMSIVKVKDGSIGVDGKTGQLIAEDYSVIYDSGGANPTYNNTSNNITLTATANNYTDAIFKFTQTAPGSDVILQNWSDTSTFAYSSIPTTYIAANWPKVIYLEVGEKPGGWSAGTAPASIDSKDSIAIVGVKSGTGGVTLVNSNHAHSYSTDKNGKIGGADAVTIPNSGTTLELIVDGIVYTYKRDNDTAYGYSGTLAEKEWEIVSGVCTTPSASHLTAGNPASISSNVVTIGTHTTTASTQENEVITYTIEYRAVGMATAKSITTTQTLSKSISGEEGDPGIDGVSVVLTPSTPTVVYSYDGTNWDPTVTSATITVSTTGLTGIGYSWSGAGSGTGATRTISFASNLAEGSIPANQTATVTVTGTKSDGSTGYNSGSLAYTIAVGKAAAGSDGDPGGPGFFFIKRTGSGADEDGEGLTAPTSGENGEVPSPQDKNIAIVENSFTPPQQAAFKFDTDLTPDAWVGVTDFFRAEVIAADAIHAKQLAISNDSSGGDGIYMNATNNRIEIYDDDDLRVKLGQL